MSVKALREQYGIERNDAAFEILLLRTKLKLSQRAFAKLVGTTASVICKLENPNYLGHSVSTLVKIAKIGNLKVQIKFVETKDD